MARSSLALPGKDTPRAKLSEPMERISGRTELHRVQRTRAAASSITGRTTTGRRGRRDARAIPAGVRLLHAAARVPETEEWAPSLSGKHTSTIPSDLVKSDIRDDPKDSKVGVHLILRGPLATAGGVEAVSIKCCTGTPNMRLNLFILA